MPDRVVVVGGGSWGTAVANLCARNTPTVLLARRPDVVDAINTRNENPRYLPGFALNPNLTATLDPAAATADATAVFVGVASAGVRATARQLSALLPSNVPVVSLAKGLEHGSLKRMTEVMSEELSGHPVGVLTGPNLAREVLDGYAAAAVVAFTDVDVAASVQPFPTSNLFRVYRSADVIGCEIAGALKNVIAIAAGMADGVGAGHNTRATVISRGLSELTRLGVAMGGDPATFAGLAGLGDLIATCASPQSRNRHVGERLGRGESIDHIIADMDQVAEGVRTVAAAVHLAERYHIEMPITREMHLCVTQGQTARQAYRGLVRDAPTTESGL